MREIEEDEEEETRKVDLSRIALTFPVDLVLVPCANRNPCNAPKDAQAMLERSQHTTSAS